MNTLSIVSMILNLSIIVGGFFYFLAKAIKNDRNKKEQTQ